MRKTVELFPHGGNGCVGSVDVVCCGTVCLASDKTSYVPHGVSVGAADAERACLLWQAAGRVRWGGCRGWTPGRSGARLEARGMGTFPPTEGAFRGRSRIVSANDPPHAAHAQCLPLPSSRVRWCPRASRPHGQSRRACRSARRVSAHVRLEP